VAAQDPTFQQGWFRLARWYLSEERYAESTDAILRWASLGGLSPENAATFWEPAIRFAQTGDPGPIPTELEKILETARPVFDALNASLLGRREQALDFLETALAQEDPALPGFIRLPFFDLLEDDPRYWASSGRLPSGRGSPMRIVTSLRERLDRRC
jgi:hypothetical protein